MKKLLMCFILLTGIMASAAAQPMGHFHRSPSHHGHHHHHHGHSGGEEPRQGH